MPLRGLLLKKPLFLIALLCPLIAWGTYLAAYKAETGQALVRFEGYLSEAAAALASEIRTCTESLYAGRALYRSSEEVTRKEFETFARDVRSRNTIIQALEWVPRVTQAERAAHEQLVRGDGIAGYEIKDRLADGRLLPAAKRAAYFPVCFVEPMRGNERALGYDLAGDDTRRSALETALTTDGVALSDPVTLVQGSGQGPGVLAVLAHFRDGAETPEDRKDKLLGYLTLVFLVQDVVEASLLRGPSAAPTRMQFMLEDADAGGTPRRLYSSGDFAQTGASPPFKRHQAIELCGQVWQLHASPSAYFLDQHRTEKPVLLGLLALLVSGALCGALVQWGRASRRREARARDLTVSSVLSSLDHGVVVAGPDGRIEFANDAAREIEGAPSHPVIAESHAADWGLFQADGVTPVADEQRPLARALRGERLVDASMFVRNPRVPQGRWLRVSAVPLVDGKGVCRGGVVVSRNVTITRDSEEERERLANAVEQTADAVFITDRNGTILYANPAFESITGYSRSEALGRTPRILKSGRHGRSFYRALWTRILAGEVHRGTTINRKRDGKIYYAEQTITPMKDRQGKVTHFVSLLKDLTDARKREEHDTELRLAGAVQRRLYPQGAPSAEGLDVAGKVISAEAACGDYFDYIPLPCGQLALVVGDVSGHGLGPALLMVETRAYLRSYLQAGAPIAAVFRDLHTRLVADLGGERFVTLLLVSVDLQMRQLTWANAGHTAALVIDRSGSLKAELAGTGPVLGIIEDSEFGCAGPLPLATGDVVVMLTDGITETRNPDGAFFEEQHVVEVVRAHAHESAQAIVDHLLAAVEDFSGGRPSSDDQTLVVFKATDVPARATDAGVSAAPESA